MKSGVFLTTVSILALVSSSCGLSHSLDGVDDAEHDERFVGDWLIQGPPRGGYEATIYRFSADGSLRAVVSDANSGAIPTGIVDWDSAGDFGAGCLFGDSWQSDGESTLIVDLRCGDVETIDELLTLVGEISPGRIEYSFLSEASLNTEAAMLTIVEVQSELGSEATGFTFWSKCDESTRTCDWLTTCESCIFHEE